jgi:hypothetical protein
MDINKIARQVGDTAERVADVSDAARGKHRGGMGARWFVLPAAGAALYAVVKNRSVRRSARDLAGQAGRRAGEMPDLDLYGRVKDVVGSGKDGDRRDSDTRTKERPAQTRQARARDESTLEENRRERAERRRRRSEATA